MLRHHLAIRPAIAALALVGCTAAEPEPDVETVGADSSASPEPTLDESATIDPTAWPPVLFSDATMPEADAAGQARADTWLEGIVLPDGAVRLDAEPTDAPLLGNQWQGWVCAPMGLATAYWHVPDLGVIEGANWFAANPGAGLMSPTMPLADDGSHLDGATVAHLPEIGSLEGIAVTVALAPGGVAVRAEIGAFGDTTVCPTPPAGQTLGGPGSG